jgi:archaellin
MERKGWLGLEGTVVLLAFVVITMILGTATVWLGSH